MKKITVVHKKKSTTGYIITKLHGDACVNNGCKEKDPGPQRKALQFNFTQTTFKLLMVLQRCTWIGNRQGEASVFGCPGKDPWACKSCESRLLMGKKITLTLDEGNNTHPTAVNIVRWKTSNTGRWTSRHNNIVNYIMKFNRHIKVHHLQRPPLSRS